MEDQKLAQVSLISEYKLQITHSCERLYLELSGSSRLGDLVLTHYSKEEFCDKWSPREMAMTSVAVLTSTSGTPACLVAPKEVREHCLGHSRPVAEKIRELIEAARAVLIVNSQISDSSPEISPLEPVTEALPEISLFDLEEIAPLET